MPRFRYHCTPKQAAPETGQRGGAKFTKAKSWLKAGARGRRRGEEGGVTIPLDNGRDNEYYGFAGPRRWAMIDIRKSEERGHANHGWLDAHFTFSLADYFDPEHVQFRSLRVMTDHKVAGGGGFPSHPHRARWSGKSVMGANLGEEKGMEGRELGGGEKVKKEVKKVGKAYVQAGRGRVKLNGTPLETGDGAAISAEKAVELTGVKDAEVLLFDLA